MIKGNCGAEIERRIGFYESGFANRAVDGVGEDGAAAGRGDGGVSCMGARFNSVDYLCGLAGLGWSWR